mmetsp:Transcript_9361/g.35038  ORF Transcript_9361/g.35038 Transcript_9361/m.35038 type:complete len:200 (-) Transcript_9361:3709-4308(-)
MERAPTILPACRRSCCQVMDPKLTSIFLLRAADWSRLPGRGSLRAQTSKDGSQRPLALSSVNAVGTRGKATTTTSGWHASRSASSLRRYAEPFTPLFCTTRSAESASRVQSPVLTGVSSRALSSAGPRHPRCYPKSCGSASTRCTTAWTSRSSSSSGATRRTLTRASRKPCHQQRHWAVASVSRTVSTGLTTTGLRIAS